MRTVESWRRSTLHSTCSAMAFSTLALPDNNNDSQYDYGCDDANDEASSSKPTKVPPPTSMLPRDVLARIMQDLKDADVNHDGRVCYEELKLILSNYSNIFTPDDIDYISNLFFVGKSGQSVRHTTFVRSLQYIASTTQPPSSASSSTEAENDEGKDKNMNDSDTASNGINDHDHDRHYHPYLVRKNPIQLEQLVDTRCWITPEENKHTDPMFAYYDTQSEFEKQLLKYIHEVIQRATNTTTTTSSSSTTTESSSTP